MADLGHGVDSGQGDAALSWEGLRAQWKGQGLDFDYFLGRDFSKLPANSFVIRKADFEDAAKKDMYERYFRGWAMGLEFGQNESACSDADCHGTIPGPEFADDARRSQLNPRCSWPMFFRPLGGAQEVGLSLPESWQLFFDMGREIGQITGDFKPRTWSRTTMSMQPMRLTPPKSRRTPTALRSSDAYKAVKVEEIAKRI